MTPRQIKSLESGEWIVSESGEVYRFLMVRRNNLVLVHLGRVRDFLEEAQQRRVDLPLEFLEHCQTFDERRHA